MTNDRSALSAALQDRIVGLHNSLSEAAFNGRVKTDLDDPAGEWSVTRDPLEQMVGRMGSIMSELGVPEREMPKQADGIAPTEDDFPF